MRDKYGIGQDKYCYPGSDVLKNLLNIRNAELLSEAETELTAERYRTYRSPVESLTDFSLDHLSYLHRHLFQDIYDWAGNLRDVDISKGNTRFCTWTRIKPEANKLLKGIPQLEGLATKQELVREIANLFCELNIIHPFREGNGRVQRFYFEELLFVLGYDIKWPKISQNAWIEANIAGVHFDLSPLEKIFAEAMSARA